MIGARETAEATGRFTRKIGNSVAFRDNRGDLVLLYASISIGGWSGSSLNLIRSTDDGETWSPPRRLVTTPLFNYSTLVKAPPVLMAGGATMVPAYQEFVRPYPEVLVLDADGQVVGRRRIGSSTVALQPQLVPDGARSARVYMRARTTGRVVVSDTADAGWSWSPLTTIDVPSFDNPVAVARLDAGHALIVFNARGEGKRRTGPLLLSVSGNRDAAVRIIHTIDDSAVSARYPWLMHGPDGDYHLLFTRKLSAGSELVHIRFNRDWVAARGGLPCS